MGCAEKVQVTDFDSFVAAGNPIMESYPQRCNDPISDRTFTEDIGNIGETCSINEECHTPMEFLVQSNCPFGSACIDDTCKVVCPLTYHDTNPEVSRSHQVTCEKDSDCDCSDRGSRSLDCRCVDSNCVSVEAE